ncbi:TIGR01244 family sulfur transferase [Erythrobacter alti]|uniref:TIGR01244 family sulfur transferase n=1 Tax=Erythrobacter alti TaxID=1896145 RepID=UPI0030F41649
MSDFRKLTDKVWASPQISEEDIAAARAQGFVMVINNRPDGEETGQPAGDAIAAAVNAQGMDYRAIPITHSGFSQAQVAAMTDALDSAGDNGKVLAYCRSGTRSTFLWALARASAGDDPNTITAAALGAGYDVSPVRETLEMLASERD